MLGLLDSGVGGLTVAKALRTLRPTADLCYLADEANAPYGTKAVAELLPILEKGVRTLLARGADRVVLACITASCLYPRLPRSIAPRVIPILPFVAREIAACGGRVGMIATEATVKSAALSQALSALGCQRTVEKQAAQERLNKAVSALGSMDGQLQGIAAQLGKDRQAFEKLLSGLQGSQDTLLAALRGPGGGAGCGGSLHG